MPFNLQILKNYFQSNIFAKLGFQIISILCLSIFTLFLYLDYKMVSSENTSKEVTANLTSQSVLDKIDRNFYERFGDVQAFAANKLAINFLSGDSSSVQELQKFMNTMTQYYVLYDLMMIIDLQGRVKMVNNLDKQGNHIASKFLINQSVIDEEWFNVCNNPDGMAEGAWYSDFCTNENVSKIYHSKGWGMAFASPIKDENGKIIGIWYNFANWEDVTQGIRDAQEKELHTSQPSATIFITDLNGKIIGANDNKLIQDKIEINPELVDSWGFELNYNGKNISFDDKIKGWATAKGAYNYKGRKWKALTIIPESKITFATFFAQDMIFAMVVILFLVSLFSYIIFNIVNNQVVKKTLYLKNVIDEFSNGNIPIINSNLISKDEIGQIVKSTKTLSENFTNMVQLFNEKVTNEDNKENNIVVFNNQGLLGTSLINMRTNLKNMLEEDNKRNWSNTGQAQMGDILRKNTENPEALYDETIKFLVKYLDINQGAIFLLNDDNQDIVDLVSCYAFNKKKFIEKNIEKGDGLVWETILEAESIYITKVPEDYIEIRSGLGGSNPTSILLVPLKTNEKVLGAIELASFSNLDKFKRDFVEKIAESVASTIANVKNNAKTKILLEISKQQSEELRATEEEMRQNLEEMSATQEEMHRKEIEMIKISQDLEAYLNGLNSTMAIIEFTPEGKIINANSIFLNVVNYSIDEIVGKHHQIFVPSDFSKNIEYQNFWKDLSQGKVKSGEFERFEKNGKLVRLKAAYTPITNAKGEVTKVVKFAFEI